MHQWAALLKLYCFNLHLLTLITLPIYTVTIFLLQKLFLRSQLSFRKMSHVVIDKYKRTDMYTNLYTV